MKYFVASIIAIVLSYGVYNSMHKKSSLKVAKQEQNSTSYKAYPNTQEGVVAYVEHVINYGSERFGFKGGEMEGGYIPKEKAKDVACYVYELSGRKCTTSYNKDAKLYFSSSCAGCHGNDAKGIHGTYPDLTKNPLLGIKN